MICDECHATVQTGNIMGGRNYCNVCYIRKFPPKLTLAFKWSYGGLYNLQNQQFVLKTIPELKNCGFVLFKHKVFFSPKVSPQFKELLVFRYFGKTKCHLIRNYNWPLSIHWCLANCV